MKKSNPVEVVVVCLVVLSIYGLFGHLDSQDELSAQAHAKHSLQLAQREEAERKAEFEYLAKKAERMTGFSGVTGK